MRKIKPWTPVIVEWVDATDQGLALVVSAERVMSDYIPAIRRTCAHYLGSDKRVTALAIDDDRGIGPGFGGEGGGLIYIPTGMVRSITPLGPK
jgi:hypothetical protein